MGSATMLDQRARGFFPELGRLRTAEGSSRSHVYLHTSSIPAGSSGTTFAGCNGSTLHQHHPHLVDGRGSTSQFRASRHTDGNGAGGLHALAAIPKVRSGRSHLAQSRPVRTFGGACVHAAVFDAALVPGK